jgi:hypothetical protein
MATPNRLPSHSAAAPSSSDSSILGGLDFRTYQELKISIHRYLLDKIDLKKISAPLGAGGEGGPGAYPKPEQVKQAVPSMGAGAQGGPGQAIPGASGG